MKVIEILKLNKGMLKTCRKVGIRITARYLCGVSKQHTMNKYYQILKKVLADGKTQKGRKGESRYLLNETVTLSPAELLDIFE